MKNPIPQRIIDDLQEERVYQLNKGREGKLTGESGWTYDFDNANTANDWAAFINIYLGQAVKTTDNPNAAEVFRRNMVKVATLAVAAVEAMDREGSAPRHYEDTRLVCSTY